MGLRWQDTGLCQDARLANLICIEYRVQRLPVVHELDARLAVVAFPADVQLGTHPCSDGGAR